MDLPIMVLYGVVAYLLVLETVLCAIGFVDDPPVLNATGGGQPGPLDSVLILDTTPFGPFAIQASADAADTRIKTAMVGENDAIYKRIDAGSHVE